MADTEAVSLDLSGATDIEQMDKDALDTYATENFGRPLDKRKKRETLVAEVLALDNGTTQKIERDEAEAAVEAAKPRSPKTVRHVVNGRTFEWNPEYRNNAELEVIEWE